MKKANIAAIFAESIRQEITGQTTLVGIYDDIAEFPQFPVVIPQLAVLATLSTLVDDPFAPESFRVFKSSGETLITHSFPNDLKSNQDQAIKQRLQDGGSPWLYLRIMINLGRNIQFQKDEKVTLELTDADGNSLTSNSLTFQEKHQSTTFIPTTSD